MASALAYLHKRRYVIRMFLQAGLSVECKSTHDPERIKLVVWQWEYSTYGVCVLSPQHHLSGRKT
jgi:hypothetical protein